MRENRCYNIHLDNCIDHEAFVPECPVEAISHEVNPPEQWKEYTALNVEMALQCPVITEQKTPLAKERPSWQAGRDRQKFRSCGAVAHAEALSPEQRGLKPTPLRLLLKTSSGELTMENGASQETAEGVWRSSMPTPAPAAKRALKSVRPIASSCAASTLAS